MQYGSDWTHIQERWTAYWDRSPVDRPCLDVKASLPVDLPQVVAPEEPVEARWLDPDYIRRVWTRYFATTYFTGEAIPIGPLLMAGTTTGCGDYLHFTPGGIGIKQSMSSIDEPVNWHPGPDDPWRAKVEALLTALLDMAEGKFLVGGIGQYPVNDLLIMLRGQTEFLMDLADDCDKCAAKLREVFPMWLEDNWHFRNIINARQDGYGSIPGWLAFWSPGYVHVTQSDMSYMISDDLFERFSMVEMDLLGDLYGRLWYHTCGCKRHVKTLLTRSYMRAFQYSPSPLEPPNGPAHVEFYRQVQNAGRCLDIEAPFENIEFLIRHLNPEGLVLRTWAPAPDAAEELLDNAKKWCGSNLGDVG